MNLKQISTIYDKNGIDLRDKINYTDIKTLQYLSLAQNLLTIFQLNSAVSADYLRKFFKPLVLQFIEDMINNKLTEEEVIMRLSDITTMIRPACQKSGVPERYLKRLQGKYCEHLIPKSNYFHSFIIKNTEKTQFELLYQEQIMGLIKDIFEVSYGIADQYRRYLEKNDEKKLNELKQIFWNKYKKIASKQDCADFWQYLLDAGGYLFNLSHAVSYSYNTYQTAFCKVYPQVALANALNIYSDKSDKVQAFLKEAVKIGINVKLPKINNSYLLNKGDIDKNTIFLSTKSVKGIGDIASNQISKNNNFTSLEHFANYCYETKGIHKGIIEILIKIDYFSDFIDMNQEQIWNWFNNYHYKTQESRDKKFIKKYNKAIYKPKKDEVIIEENENTAIVEISTKAFDLSEFKQKFKRKNMNIYFNEITYLGYPLIDLNQVYNLSLNDDERIIIVDECITRKGGKTGNYLFTLLKDIEGNTYFYSGKHLHLSSGSVLKISFNESIKGLNLLSFEQIDYIDMNK